MSADTNPVPTLPARLAVEFVGTFFLLLTITMVVVKAADLSIIAPLPIGLVLIALVYAGGPISGAHYNPAVTVGFSLSGRFPWREAIPYIAAQCAGSLSAALVAMSFRGQAETMVEPAIADGFVAEAIWTFLLMFVILQVTAPRNAGNQWFGVAIGMTVAAGAWAVGPTSGAVFNPAVWAGLSLAGKLAWMDWWLYILAPLAGVIVAVGVDVITSRTAPRP
ncbi:MAG: aquaporin family protein [Phycisphaerales bacterium]|nr:aquaporin family protein [Phycisphaerales bacterium]